MVFLELMDKLELQEEMVQQDNLVHQDSGVPLEELDYPGVQDLVDHKDQKGM